MSAALSRHHGALSLFAEAIVGRPVPVEPVDGRCWPEAVSDPSRRGAAVPAEIALDGEPARRRYRAIVLHQLVAIEEQAGVELDRGAMRRRHPLLPAVFQVLEDRRVDAVTRRRYPGSVGDLDELLAEATSAPSSPLPPAVERLRGQSLRPAAVDLRPGDPVSVALAEVDRNGATIADSMHAAIRFCDLLSADDDRFDTLTAEPDAPAELEVDGSADGSVEPDGDVASVEQRKGLRGDQAMEDPDGVLDRGATGEADDEDDEPTGGLELPFGRAALDTDAGTRTFVYDEWDFRANRHRPSWCRLLERRLEGDDHGFLAVVRDRHAELRADIRRRFARLRPEALTHVHRADDGEELDLDAILVAIADRRGGAPADDRVHIRRDRSARDIATAFLVDLSASTSSPVDPPEPKTVVDADAEDDALAPLWVIPEEPAEPPRRVIDVAKDAVALMSDALEELGDRHAIYGFSGTGRHQVDFAVAKDFRDRHAPDTWAAVAAMRPLRYTRMGAAVRHATAKLHAEAAKTRLLIVISDGYPQDVDYGEDARDRAHGMHDTARALADAQRAGVDTFCITIDPAGHDYLREMCPDQRYLVIDDVEALPAELAKVYLALRSR